MNGETDLRKAEARRDSAASRVEEFRAAEDALKKRASPDLNNIEAVLAYEQQLAAAGARVRIASRALDVAETALATANAEAAEKAGKARHAALTRQARDAERLVRQIEARQRLLAADLEQLEAHRRAIATANADPAIRKFGFLADAEERVRQRPARTVPAVFEHRETWRRRDGSEPMSFFTNKAGELVPTGGDAERVRERVQVSPERFEAAQMPARLGEAIKLVALDGASLWPVRS